MTGRPWKDIRAELLAAASSASSGATDLIETARLATGEHFTRSEQLAVLTALNDALRLTIGAGADPADASLLDALEDWMADNG